MRTEEDAVVDALHWSCTGVARSLGKSPSAQAAEVSGDAHAPAGRTVGHSIRSKPNHRPVKLDASKWKREESKSPSAGLLRRDARKRRKKSARKVKEKGG